VEVFNFEVEHAHTYHVGCGGLRVHNSLYLEQAHGHAELPLYARKIIGAATAGSATDWNVRSPAMVAHMQAEVSKVAHLFPNGLSPLVRLANGQQVPVLVQPSALDLASGGEGAQKAFRLFASPSDVPYKMGIAINLPGVNAINIPNEAAMYGAFTAVPIHKVHLILPVAQPRIHDDGDVRQVVFDRDRPTAPLALGLVMEARPANSPTHKLPEYLLPLMKTVNGQLESPLAGLPGWDMLGPSASPQQMSSALIRYALLTGNLDPLISRFKENAHIPAQTSSTTLMRGLGHTSRECDTRTISWALRCMTSRPRGCANKSLSNHGTTESSWQTTGCSTRAAY
jgi:hypothetical protein